MAYTKLAMPCNNLYTLFLSSVVIILVLGSVSRAQTILAAVYVFGDSLVDVGNNNYISLSIIKADFPRNRIDYPGQKSTGRFSNGKNSADFLAEKVGLASPPPYLAPNNAFLKGVSFASGGAGIFNTTSEGPIKQVIPLAQQISYLWGVRERLVKEMGSTTSVQQHFSKSLFPIVIGSNDIINYFNPDSELPKKYTPQQYVTLMASTLRQMLKGIYGIGARKFLLIGLPPIGCAPKQRFQNTSDECNNIVNYWSNKYNQELKQMLPELKSELQDFQYSYFDTYTVFLDFIQNPTTYGFSEVKSACCGLGRLRAQLPCTPLSLLCLNRSSHIFWDVYHPTESAARLFINKLFDASANYVSPITVQQLITL